RGRGLGGSRRCRRRARLGIGRRRLQRGLGFGLGRRRRRFADNLAERNGARGRWRRNRLAGGRERGLLVPVRVENGRAEGDDGGGPGQGGCGQNRRRQQA